MPLIDQTMDMISSGMNANMQLGQNLYNNAWNARMQKSANKANAKLWEDQRNWNEQMWHLQNEYNTPEAQMQRFQEAGLNPNLIYGQGTSGNATQVASGVQPPDIKATTSNINMGKLYDSFQDMKMKSESIENMRLKNEQQIDANQYQKLQNEALQIANERAGLSYKGEQADYSTNRASTRLNYFLQMQTAMLNQQNYNSNAIKLSYQEYQERLSLLKGQAEIYQMQSRGLLNMQEYNFIKEHGFRIPTKMIPGLFTRMVLENAGKQNVQKAVQGLKSAGEYLREAVEKHWKNPKWRYPKSWKTGDNSRFGNEVTKYHSTTPGQMYTIPK